MHIGVFILLLLSGERNFGVRLNKPYTATIPMDIPVFSGTHADLLLTVFHKIIATGHQRLQPLFDCLLTILVNVSPYLKTLSMVASIKLLHLLEAFGTPWFLFSSPANHHLVFFLLEIFNNIIQYQFDGNSNLVYTIIRKRQVFHALANIPSDTIGINKCMNSRKMSRINRPPELIARPNEMDEEDDEDEVVIFDDQQRVEKKQATAAANGSTEEAEVTDEDRKSDTGEIVMEGSRPALPAEPGTLKATLLETPNIGQMTANESAHPSTQQLQDIALAKEIKPASDLTNGEADICGLESGTPLKLQTSPLKRSINTRGSIRVTQPLAPNSVWQPTPEWVQAWRAKLPLQTIMRLLQVLVPQVEKICIDK